MGGNHAFNIACDTFGVDWIPHYQWHVLGDFFKDAIFVDSVKHPTMKELAVNFHGAMEMAVHGLTTLPFWLALAGVASSYYMYMVVLHCPQLSNAYSNQYLQYWKTNTILIGLMKMYWPPAHASVRCIALG